MHLFHEEAFFAMGEWRSINGKLVFVGGQSFVTSFYRGVLLFVTKCDEGEGVENRPKSRDVIYGRPHI